MRTDDDRKRKKKMKKHFFKFEHSLFECRLDIYHACSNVHRKSPKLIQEY